MLPLGFRLTSKHTFFVVIFLIATALCIYHSYTVIYRHVKYEILEIRRVVYNESLPMPIVTLQLDSYRNLPIIALGALFENVCFLRWSTFQSSSDIRSRIRLD